MSPASPSTVLTLPAHYHHHHHHRHSRSLFVYSSSFSSSSLCLPSDALSPSASSLCDDAHHLYLSATRIDADDPPNLDPTKLSTQGQAAHKPLVFDPARRLHIRSLTFPSILESPFEDMSAADVSSGSPPELTRSPSSTRSSSRRSSSTTREEVEDVSHFEDIALNDVQQQFPIRTSSRKPIRPSPLMRNSGGGKPRGSPSPPPRTSSSPALSSSPSRDLTNGLRTAATLNNHARNANSRASPPGGFPRRMQSSGPSLPVPINTGRRTPSPPKQFSTSPISPVRTSPRHRSENTPTPVLPVRRGSWQPTRRKSAKEIEQEYHDSDEELPDDFVVWNVPLSPRPAGSRQNSMGFEPTTRVKSAPEPPVHPTRTKSWSDALFDLSDEAQKLTAALEDHAEICGEDGSPPSSPPKSKSRANSVEMPPLQRSSVGQDPLPVSKEKEKHLTRTRPGWLPPKCPKEEKRHLKEYKQMMSSFYESEKRKSATETKDHVKHGQENDSNVRLWKSDVLNDWENAIKSPRVRELWWKGIPPAVRGRVWCEAIGNDLHLSQGSYEAALTRARAVEQRLAAKPAPDDGRDEDARERRSLKSLQADIDAAFPSLNLFQPDQPQHSALRNLLMAYASYRSDTGHVRGAAGMAALLLMHIPDESDAFVALANLLNSSVSLPFCLGDEVGKDRLLRAVMRAMKHKLPRLHSHLVGLEPLRRGEALECGIQTLFTGFLAPEEAARVWDVFVFEGEAAVVRAAVGVMARLEGKLYGESKEVLSVIGWEGGYRINTEPVDVGGADMLVDAIRWAGREDVATSNAAPNNATTVNGVNGVSGKSSASVSVTTRA